MHSGSQSTHNYSINTKEITCLSWDFSLSHQFFWFLFRMTNYSYSPLRGVDILTRSLLRPAQSHQLCLKWDFTMFWTASTTIRNLHALSFPYSPRTNMICRYRDYLLKYVIWCNKKHFTHFVNLGYNTF